MSFVDSYLRNNMDILGTVFAIVALVLLSSPTLVRGDGGPHGDGRGHGEGGTPDRLSQVLLLKKNGSSSDSGRACNYNWTTGYCEDECLGGNCELTPEQQRFLETEVDPFGTRFIPKEIRHEFIGDMRFPPERTRSRTNRAAPLALAPVKRWENNIIPFIITTDFSPSQRDMIIESINVLRKNTCIHFVERTTEVAYVSIIKGMACMSSVGRQGREQYLTLADGCLHSYTVQHELLHVLGYKHEHVSPNRDDHVIIHEENFLPKYAVFFKKENVTTSVPYDYNSIMHYSSYAFSKNGQPTITARRGDRIISKAESLSPLDVKRIGIDFCNAGSTEYTDCSKPVSCPKKGSFPHVNRQLLWYCAAVGATPSIKRCRKTEQGAILVFQPKTGRCGYTGQAACATAPNELI